MTAPARPGPITVLHYKWPDQPHWRYALHSIGEDEHGVWLGAPRGSVVQRGHEPPITMKYAWVHLVPHTAWWGAYWNEEGAPFENYVDVADPAGWDGDTVSRIDLDLDVIRHWDGRVEVEDENEFEDHQVRYGYPEHVIAAARTATAALVVALESRTEPFGEVGAARLQDWLARLRP